VTDRPGDAVRFLTSTIGYADLARLTVPEVDEMFERFKHTKAIVFDMRGYPKGTAWAIAPRLARTESPVAALFDRPLAICPSGAAGEVGEERARYHVEQRLPGTTSWRYEGTTVMLIDERTISQAEHTGLFLEAANGTRFVGSPSNGANGDVTRFRVPGGIHVTLSGHSVRHADGRQLQRIGLIPHLEARPTIEGIRSGRDEVLEAALEYVERETGGR
jgi:hypothetical protein